MALRKLKTSWQVEWRNADGQKKRKSFPSKVLAQQFQAQQTLIDSLEGETQKACKLKQTTFQELANRFIDEHLSKTRADNHSYINKLISEWGDYKLSRITPALVRNWISDLLYESNYEVSTVKKFLTYFKRVFNWGIEIEEISTNPIKSVTFKKEFRRINKRNYTIDSEEFWSLMDKLPESPKHLKNVCIALWCTGMRIGEIMNLKWSNISLKEGLIILGSHETKEADHKIIGIEYELLILLRELQNESKGDPKEYVFLNSKGGMLTYRPFNRHFRKAMDAQNYRNLNIHDLRHCYTRRKRVEGFSKSVIKAQTGHHTDSMFNWYDKVEVEEIKDMAGFSTIDAEIIQNDIIELVKVSKKNSIPLGKIQALFTKSWREMKI